MIKFFRKIRQKMLSENKFSKYLIYAIGEIILVVIGILIALQINNLNENSKKRVEEIAILKNISLDIDNDLRQLEGNIEFSTKFQDSLLLDYKTALKQKLKNPKTLLARFFGATNINFFEVHSGSFDESLSSGKFTYIQNDSIREEISNYYLRAKQSFMDDAAREYAISELRPLFFKVLGVKKEYFLEFGLETDFPNMNFNAMLKDERLGEILLTYNSHTMLQKRQWERFKSSAINLKQSITKEIEQLSTNE